MIISKETKKFIKFLNDLFKPYRYKLILVIALINLYSVCVVYFPKMIGRIVKLFEHYNIDRNIFISPDFYNQIIILTVIIIFTYILKLVINYMMYPISEQLTYNLRKIIFEKILSVNNEYLDRHNSGDIMERMNHDTLNIRNMIGVHLSSLVAKVLLIIFSLILMLVTDVELTAIYFVILFIFIIITFILSKLSIKKFVMLESNIGKMMTYIGDTLLNKSMLNVFKSSEYTRSEFDKVNDNDRKDFNKSTFFTISMIPISWFIANLGYIFIYIQSAYLIMNHQIHISVLLTFVLYGQIVISQMRYFGKSLHLIQITYSSFIRIYQLLSANDREENNDLIELDEVNGDIEFRNVSFAYDNEKLLDNVNFKIDAGSTTVISARPSSGKTTLVKLLTKFYRVNDGEILLDGVNINDIRQKSILNNCTVISPDNQIFTDTIYENIAYVLDNPSYDKVESAAKAIGSHEYIMNLPDGYDTVISDEKNNISQGERQLILLTRAYLDSSKNISTG